MSEILLGIDWDKILFLVFGAVFSLFLQFSYRSWRKSVEIKRRNTASGDNQNKFALAFAGTVFSQATLGDISADKSVVSQVKDLGSMLREYVEKNTILNGKVPTLKLRTTAAGETTGPVVWLDATRFSTFFVFTDGKRVLFYDRLLGSERSKAAPEQSIRAVARYDMFGTVAFDAAGWAAKIPNDSFHRSVIVRMDAIPGIAVEQTTEVPENIDKRDADEQLALVHAFPRSTVVMVGFCIELSSADLDEALVEMHGTTSAVTAVDFRVTNVELPDAQMWTSKATLGIGYLRKMYPY